VRTLTALWIEDIQMSQWPESLSVGVGSRILPRTIPYHTVSCFAPCVVLDTIALLWRCCQHSGYYEAVVHVEPFCAVNVLSITDLAPRHSPSYFLRKDIAAPLFCQLSRPIKSEN
jgi:hypothetical protein